jgi:hypothetical protein
MENKLNDTQTKEQPYAEHFGIELKEVGFDQFDRRKAPRKNNYDSLMQSLESTPMEVEFIY